MSSELISFRTLLESLLEGNDLSSKDSSFIMEAWLAEKFQPVQTGALLAAYRAKGVSGIELASMAEVLRDACPLPCALPSIDMVDTCGTGGDGAETFNISTAVAFTAAACGANVAKHGNRSASGKVGSADVLEGLGLRLDAPLERVVEVVLETNITFLFAPAWHPALVNLAPLRKSIGVRTIFNLLGPLVNPLRPSSQVLGVAKDELLDPISQALLGLNLNRGVVVFGAGGLDEASLSGPNYLRFIEKGTIKTTILDPVDLGLALAPVESLRGGDLATNQQIFEEVLKGCATKPQCEVVALNTALVLWASGIEDDIAQGAKLALESLSSGLPWEKFEELRNALIFK